MKRFVFSLDGVLRFKQQRERMAELRVMEAKAQVDRARLRVEQIEQQLARLAEEMAASREPAGAFWSAKFELSARVGQSLREAMEAHEQAVRDHSEAVRERARRTAEVEAIQIVRRKHWDEYRRELQRHEQLERDEFGMRAWQPPGRQG